MHGQIAKALHEVMSSVSYVQKTGKNSFHNYRYAGEADLLGVLRPAMIEAGLLLIPSVEEVSSIDEHGITHVRISYTLMHKDGEVWPHKIIAAGCGGDRNKNGVGDKGLYKAITGANKYLLFKLFQIETGDDPESDSTHEATPMQKPAAPVQRRSAAQSKRDGGLDGLRADLADCKSAVSLEKLRKDYQDRVYPTWPKSWVDPAEMEFDARLAEFSSGEHLEQTLRDSAEVLSIGKGRDSDKIEDQAEYIRYAHDWIAASTGKAQRAGWWQLEKPARTRLRLTQAEVDDLKERIVEKNKEPDDAPWGRDKGGNASIILDAG